MKPLFVFAVDTTLPRGDSTHVREFAHHIMQECPECKIFTYNDVNIRNRMMQRAAFRVLLWCKYVLNNHDKVYLRYFPGIFLDMYLLRLLGKDVFVELNAVLSDEAEDLNRSGFFKLITAMDEKFICKFSKALVAVTPEIRDFYRQRYGKLEAFVVNNGVDTELFDPKSTEFPSEIERLRGRFIVGFVGSLSPWQDFSTLLESIYILVRKRGIKNISCIIVGTGLEEKPIRHMIASMKIEQYVELTGAKKYESIPNFINAFSVAVAPLKGSRVKNTGSAAIKVFEYLAMGKPVILTEVGTLSNMISKEEIGLVYKSSNPEDMADKIFRVYSGTLDVESLKARSRALVESHYSWAAVVKETVTILALTKVTP